VIIKAIEPGNNMLQRTATITAVDAADGVWHASDGTTPPFVSAITGTSWCAPPKPPHVHVYASDSVPNGAGVIDAQTAIGDQSASGGIYRLPGAGPGCPDVDAQVTMADGSVKRAGDV